MIFMAENIIIIGSGPAGLSAALYTAREDSLFLTKFVNSVTVVHRRNQFRASKIMQERVLSNQKIKVIWDSSIDEIIGDEKVSKVKIKNPQATSEP